MINFDETSFYKEWITTLPSALLEGPPWKLHVYREACFLMKLAWHDTRSLIKQEELRPVAGQLYRAVGSIGANIAEGFGRNSAKDRIRFWEYALTSAQEAQHWYISLQSALPEAVLRHRIEMMASINRQLTSLIPKQKNIREATEDYDS